jgi:H+/Cl- antiporter ClcA
MLHLTPELHLLALNAGLLGIAYFGIYPSLRRKSLGRIVVIDLALTAMALSIAGSWYWGSGLRFDLWLFQTNWAVFTLITLFVLEIPLFIRFARKYRDLLR